jgi:hypothetical protein
MEFNTQGSRIIIVVVQIGAVKIICSSSGGAQEKGKDKMTLTSPPKLMVFRVSTPLNTNVLFLPVFFLIPQL